MKRIPKGWRRLKAGTRIKSTDKFSSSRMGHWMTSIGFGFVDKRGPLIYIRKKAVTK